MLVGKAGWVTIPIVARLYAGAAGSPSRLCAILQQLIQQLRKIYPDCAPLRTEIGKIDKAIAIIEKASAPKPATRTQETA